MNVERHNAPLNRADLLWCFFTPNEVNYSAIANLLGFEELPTEEQKFEINAKLFEIEPTYEAYIEPALKPTPSVKVAGPSYYRIQDRHKDAQQAESAEANLARPDWFTEAKPSYFQETETRIPARHRVRLEFPPLLPWSRLWPFLQRTLGADVAGTKPDIPKLVKQVSQGKRISRIPKRSRFTWSPSACVLIDINEDNFPYRHDFLRLQQQLTDWRGADGLDIRFVYAEPGGHVLNYRDGHETLQPWRSPEPDMPLLILSDLGSHGRSSRRFRQWLLFGEQLVIQGVRATVLMPVAERDVDKRLLRYFNCVVWDSNSRLKTLKGDHKPAAVDNSAPIENLLALLLPAVRVDLGLLRAVRRLLPADRYDVGHEAAVWHHAAVNAVSDEWAWQADSKRDYQERFMLQFEALAKAGQAQLIEQLGRHHAQFPDELYFEAMLELILRGVALPDDVKVPTEAFMSLLVKTVYDPQSITEGLALWAKRYVARIQDSSVRRNSEHQIALIVAVELLKQGGDTAQIEWPSDIPPEKILPFLNRQHTLQTFLLRQKGMELELLSEQDAQASSGDFGSEAITLLTLSIPDSHIFYCYRAEDGQYKQVSLNLETTRQVRLKLQPGTQQKIQVGMETIDIEVQSAGDASDWIARRGMGDDTVYIETQSRDGKYYKWYWHPPAMGQISPESNSEHSKTWQTYPGFWFYQAPNQDYKPAWADDADRDRFGLYADVTLAGVLQRFRWIQPGSFLMGSPENEDGRYDDEILHRVNLSQGYWLADTACTQALWQAVMHSNPSRFTGETRPVESVSWDDVQKFLQRLNEIHPALDVRLPTEAEWEYACRAESTGAFSFDGELTLAKANYRGTWDNWENWGEGALQHTAEVKTYPPNAWGLYEIHGNVLEWCQDWYGEYPSETVTDPHGPDTGDYRVLRGGSWHSLGRFCRSAFRYRFAPFNVSGNCGFRLAQGLVSIYESEGHETRRNTARATLRAPNYTLGKKKTNNSNTA